MNADPTRRRSPFFELFAVFSTFILAPPLVRTRALGDTLRTLAVRSCSSMSEKRGHAWRKRASGRHRWRRASTGSGSLTNRGNALVSPDARVTHVVLWTSARWRCRRFCVQVGSMRANDG